MVKGPDGRGQRAGGWWAQATRVETQTALALGLCGAFIPPNLLQHFQVPEQTLFTPCCRWKKKEVPKATMWKSDLGSSS